MFDFFSSFLSLLNDVYTMRCLLIIMECFIITFKTYLVYSFICTINKAQSIPSSWIFLFIALLCSTFEDIAWICSMLRFTWYPSIDYRTVLFIIRITWALNTIMYQSFALFIENFLPNDNNRISLHQKIFIFISTGFVLYFGLIGITMFNTPLKRHALEFLAFRAETIFTLLILTPYTLFFTWIQLKKTKTNHIVKNQFRTVAQMLVLPHAIFNVWVNFSFNPSNESYSVVAQIASTILLTTALFYSLKKVISMRFLNVHKHVHSADGFNFTNDFKATLEALGYATTLNEIKLLTQRFFNQAFGLPIRSISLNVHNEYESAIDEPLSMQQFEKNTPAIEQFFNKGSNGNEEKKIKTLELIKNSKVLIYDEVEFDYFYEKDSIREAIVDFLNNIEADIFIPIYEQNNFIGYIIVERNARPGKLYSDLERDEMLVFVTYLAKIINLLQNRNLSELLKQRKEIIEELYLKHQEINQYKESIRSFLRNQESGSGIVLFKNKRFNLINKEAHTLLKIDPNKDEGHQLTKQLHHIVQQTLTYQSTQTHNCINGDNKKVVISSVLLSDYNAVILTICYPEIYDTIKPQIDTIKDPSDWDYLLYLETTQSGTLINQLIPGTGELFLNFKIELLKLALSKKALLLDIPEDDLIPMVELLHHISLRETLHILDLQTQTSAGHNAITLFGINPMYGTNPSIPLLEKLDRTGTLFIKNIHLLDNESQENLAQLIRYGFYTVYKSQKRLQSDVRIICSTHLDLTKLVQERKFSQTLFHELRKTSLSMPSLMTLSHNEINKLIDGFTQQSLTNPELNTFLNLSESEREKITLQRPVSLQELKTRVQHLLIAKSRKHEMYNEEQFDTSYGVSDPKLIEIARLGKQALKDPKIVRLLWGKFNNQNKIALFLGVNRSSVNRRCKEYGIY